MHCNALYVQIPTGHFNILHATKLISDSVIALVFHLEKFSYGIMHFACASAHVELFKCNVTCMNKL